MADRDLKFVSITRHVRRNGSIAQMNLSTSTGRIREIMLWPDDMLKIIKGVADAMDLKEDDYGSEH